MDIATYSPALVLLYAWTLLWILMENGLPVSLREGHGYGCRSIRAIAEHYRGQCSLETVNGEFVLRVILPLEKI